jgi:hypothetical protein
MNPKKFKPQKQPVHNHPAPLATEDEDADPVGKIPNFDDLDEAIKRVKRPAKAKDARSADSLQREAEVTEAAMPTPSGVTHPNF